MEEVEFPDSDVAATEEHPAMTPSLPHPPSRKSPDSVAATEDHPTMTPSLSRQPSMESPYSVADTEDHPRDSAADNFDSGNHTLRISDKVNSLSKMFYQNRIKFCSNDHKSHQINIFCVKLQKNSEKISSP